MSHDSEKGPRQEREHPEGWQEAGGCKCVGLTWARLSVPGPGHSPAGNVGEQGMDFGDRMGERFPPRSCWVWLRTRHPLEAPTGCSSPGQAQPPPRVPHLASECRAASKGRGHGDTVAV